MPTDAGTHKGFLHTAVFFVIMFLGWVLPPIGLPEMGMKICGVFLALLYGWTFIGFSWPSMACILALGFTGYAEPGAIIGQAFGHPIVLFTIFVLVFTKYCDQSGLNEYMAKWLLSRKMFAGHPWLFTCFVLIGTLVIGFLIDGVPAVFLISGLLYTIFLDAGFRQGEAYPAYMLAGVCIAGVLSFMCKPWMGQNILGINALAEVSGGAASISNIDLIAVTFPVCVGCLLVYTLIMRFVFRLDVSPLRSLSPEYLASLRSGISFGREQQLAALFLCIFLIFMVLPNLLPRGTAIAAFFAKFSMTVAITVIMVPLSFIRLNGRAVFDFQKCSSGINWNVIWMLAASIPISAALSGKGAGLGVLITDFLQTFQSGGSPLLFVCAFTLFAGIMTQITHNVTIVLIAVPIIWNLAHVSGINAAGMTLMLFLGAGAAFATPAASTVGALSFANGEWIGVERAFKAGFAGWLAALVCTFAIGLPLVSACIGI